MNEIYYLQQAIDPSWCISEAWELVKRRFWLYIGACLLTIVLAYFIPCLSMFLVGPVMGGLAYLVLRDSRNEPVSFGMLFKGFEKFLPLMVVGVIQAVPSIIYQAIDYASRAAELLNSSGSSDPTFFVSPMDRTAEASLSGIFIVFYIGYLLFSIIWGYALTFAIPLIIERSVGVGDAIKLSMAATFSNLGGLFVLGLLGGLVILLGMLAICLGLFVAVPVVLAANVLAYRQVFPLPGDSGIALGHGYGKIFGDL
jgi:hypothetical protein